MTTKINENQSWNIYKSERSSEKSEKDFLSNNNHVTSDGSRIVNSGKIYRQLFDSEVQLINALENFRKEKPQKIDIVFCSSNLKLGQRYKVLPNIQNQVSLLPENVSSNKNKSEVIPKILEIRKAKFENQLDEIEDTISSISDYTNDKIIQICQKLQNKICSMNENVKIYIDKIEEKNLLRFEYNEFNECQLFLYGHQLKLKENIEEFYKVALEYESDRIKKIKKYLSKSSFELERIGHIPPTDVHRLVLVIMSEFNKDILKNRESFSDIRTKLMMTCIYEDRKQHIYLDNKMKSWREAVTNFHLDEFRNRINDEDSSINRTITQYVDLYNPQLTDLNEQLNIVITSIVNKIQPDFLTNEVIDSWKKALLKIKEDYDDICEKFSLGLNEYSEKIYSEFLRQSNQIKEILLKKKVYIDENECSQIVEEVTIKMIGNLHKKYEEIIDNFELDFNVLSKHLDNQIYKIGDLVESLSVLWREHYKSLDSMEDSINLKLNSSRDSHQNVNVEMENSLNCIIDEMRQGASDSYLKDTLKKCVTLLDKIKNSYQQFKTEQMTILKKYPVFVESEVKKFIEVMNRNFEKKQCFIKEKDEEQEQERENEDKHSGHEEDQEEKVDKETSRKSEFNINELDLSNTRLLEMWKEIELFYTNYLVEWNSKSQQNSNKIIATKSEELESELQLRLHLHEPRQRRIEYDVHNVRSAELSIHGERVSRQIRHVETLLANIKDKYSEMDESQKLKQEEFKERFMNIDDVGDISNQSKLQNVRRKLDAETTNYMKTLRLDLREFRKTVEKRLQDIRKSNAEFVCSFKLFSDGGNFCPEEIDSFSKRVEKVNQKVDEVEGEIMSNLESVEKQENDFVLNLKSGFEDKFKHHVVDIGFGEKVTRALAELQVQIKSEVANSNGQSQNILERLKSLYSKIKKHQSSSEIISSYQYIDQEVYDEILALFSAAHDRSIYLECLKPQSKGPVTKSSSDNPDQAAAIQQSRVHFNAITMISKRGKQPSEDVGLKTVKELLKSQNGHVAVSKTKKASIGVIKLDKETVEKDVEVNNSSNVSSSRRTSIPLDNSNKSEKTSKTLNKSQIQEKKAAIFNDNNTDSALKTTFLGKIKGYCKTILDGVLYAADIYYKHKGGRKVTQSGIEDTLDLAADNIIAKVKGYYQQTEDYRSECLQEFNKQLIEMENITKMFPNLVYTTMINKLSFEMSSYLVKLDTNSNEILKQLSDAKKQNNSDLRPNLGHPNNRQLLDELCKKEEARQKEEMEKIQEYIHERKDMVRQYGQKFIRDITCVTEELFLLMDNLLTTNEVVSAKNNDQWLNVHDIIRERLKTTLKDVEFNQDNFGKGTWITKDLKDMIEEISKSLNMKGPEDSGEFSLITSKSTVCHLKIIEDRIKIVQEFKQKFYNQIRETEELEKKLKIENDNFIKYWTTSVSNLVEVNTN